MLARHHGHKKAEREDEGATPESCEMVRNPGVLLVFRTLVERPLLVILVWVVLLLASLVIRSQYSTLKRKPLHLPSFHNRLKHVQDSLMSDFALGGSNNSFECVLIWSPEPRDLRGSQVLQEASTAVQDALRHIKEGNTPWCGSWAVRKMVWQSYSPAMPAFLAQRFMARDGSASAVLVSHPCIPGIRKMLAQIDGKYDGLRIAMGSPNAVTFASMDQVGEKMMHHMVICVPIMWILLWLNVGNMFRASTSFICLACSYAGTQASTVIIKWFWTELNFSGPDQLIIFIELALCLDYGLFFWTRFSQERRQRPEKEFYEAAVMTTLKTSGAVINVSVAVLVIGYIAMCFYPDQNTVGCLAGNIQLIIGINLLGIYSLVVPASLAVQFPSLFDEKKHAELSFCGLECATLDRLMLSVRSIYRGWFTRLSFFITGLPWMILLPLLVYACFVPFFVEVREFRPNFDMFGASTSRTVPEYEAMSVLKAKFNLGHMEPVLVLLTANRPGIEPGQLKDIAMPQLRTRVRRPGKRQPNTPEALVAGSNPLPRGNAELTASLTQQFRGLACRYIENVLQRTRGQEYSIGPRDVQGIWWNATSGTCAKSAVMDLENLGLMSGDGLRQVVKLFPPVSGTSLGAQAMTKDFWAVIEPESLGTFNFNGQHYDFRAEHFSPLATIMLMQREFSHRAPWVLATLVVVICIVVGLLFSSVGVGLKMLVTVILPIIAEFGLIVGIYQNGWMEWAGIPRTGGLMWTHIYTGMGLLLGLAIDYDIFLFARVYERRMEGFDNISAVRLAITETGSVITVAGTVMCISFFFVAKSDIYFVSQLGVMYFLGVALDTYIVRTLLAPAMLCLSEKMNYWPGHVPRAIKTWDGDSKKLMK